MRLILVGVALLLCACRREAPKTGLTCDCTNMHLAEYRKLRELMPEELRIQHTKHCHEVSAAWWR